MQPFTPDRRDSILNCERRLLQGSESTKGCSPAREGSETECSCQCYCLGYGSCHCWQRCSCNERKPQNLQNTSFSVELHRKLKVELNCQDSRISLHRVPQRAQRLCAHSSLHWRRHALSRLSDSAELVHFLCFLLANSLRRTGSHFRTNLHIALSLLLLSASILPSTAAQNGIEARQDSHSSSLFQPWVIDSNPDPQLSSTEMFRFPDLVIPANKLFQYQIPSTAFQDLETILYYKVCKF